jgi:hypothetical protein
MIMMMTHEFKIRCTIWYCSVCQIIRKPLPRARNQTNQVQIHYGVKYKEIPVRYLASIPNTCTPLCHILQYQQDFNLY